jgi:hypothetical protein
VSEAITAMGVPAGYPMARSSIIGTVGEDLHNVGHGKIDIAIEMGGSNFRSHPIVVAAFTQCVMVLVKLFPVTEHR